MKNRFVAVVLACALAPAFAADGYRFDPNHTRPMFEVSHMGLSTQHGRFGKADGRAVLDTAAKKGSVDLVIDTASVDMGTDEWNKHMRSDEFFDTAKYPTITFRSDRLLFDGDRVVGAEGQFTLMGVTKPLRVSIEHFHCAPNPMTKVQTCGGDVRAQIKRSDFGMNKFLPMVGDEATIRVPFEATRD